MDNVSIIEYGHNFNMDLISNQTVFESVLKAGFYYIFDWFLCVQVFIILSSQPKITFPLKTLQGLDECP